MDFSKMLKQAQEMQQKMMEAKDGLKNVIAEGVSGGGAVKVQMNGHFEVTKIDISDEILKEEKVIKNEMSSNEINNLIKHNFSFCWYQFYKFLFPYCLRWKNYFGDMEIFTIFNCIIYKQGNSTSIFG